MDPQHGGKPAGGAGSSTMEREVEAGHEQQGASMSRAAAARGASRSSSQKQLQTTGSSLSQAEEGVIDHAWNKVKQTTMPVINNMVSFASRPFHDDDTPTLQISEFVDIVEVLNSSGGSTQKAVYCLQASDISLLFV